jgi:prepilin-type N-terminal cleavage/methylation domain-containing protein
VSSPTPLSAGDNGFTLPELLVAVTIMVLLMGTLGFTLASTLRVLSNSQDRVSRANDASLIGFVFPEDVSNASTLTSGSSLTAPCGTGTPVATMKTGNVRTTGTAASDQNVWYGVNGKGAFMRYECNGNRVVNTTTLADSVTGTSITCQAQLTASPWFAAATVCTAATMPSRVVLTVTVRSTATSGSVPVDAAQTMTLYGALR